MIPQWLKVLIWLSPGICLGVGFWFLAWQNPTLTDMQLWQVMIAQHWKFLVGMIVLQAVGIVMMATEDEGRQ